MSLGQEDEATSRLEDFHFVSHLHGASFFNDSKYALFRHDTLSYGLEYSATLVTFLSYSCDTQDHVLPNPELRSWKKARGMKAINRYILSKVSVFDRNPLLSHTLYALF